MDEHSLSAQDKLWLSSLGIELQDSSFPARPVVVSSLEQEVYAAPITAYDKVQSLLLFANDHASDGQRYTHVSFAHILGEIHTRGIAANESAEQLNSFQRELTYWRVLAHINPEALVDPAGIRGLANHFKPGAMVQRHD